MKRKITSTSESSWGDYPIKFLSQFDGRFHLVKYQRSCVDVRRNSFRCTTDHVHRFFAESYPTRQGAVENEATRSLVLIPLLEKQIHTHTLPR
jgi:hypothetical protein